jgi:hypothetical protein
MKNLIVTCFVAALLTACQSTSDNATDITTLCNNDNWTEFGHKTALAGKSVRTFNTYKDKCADKLPQTAKETYLTGFRAGLKEFCTYENGYKTAEVGKENTKLCPLELRAEFDLGYTKGYKDLKDKKSEAKRLADQAEQRKMAERPNPQKG